GGRPGTCDDASPRRAGLARRALVSAGSTVPCVGGEVGAGIPAARRCLGTIVRACAARADLTARTDMVTRAAVRHVSRQIDAGRATPEQTRRAPARRRRRSVDLTRVAVAGTTSELAVGVLAILRAGTRQYERAQPREPVHSSPPPSPRLHSRLRPPRRRRF